MSDPEQVLGILSSILIAIERSERRFQGIAEPDDFVINDEGIDRLDGIAMMLIAIAEQVKRLDGATETNLADAYPEIDWKGVKGTRDVLSHHYFSADAEIISKSLESTDSARAVHNPDTPAVHPVESGLPAWF